MIACDVFGALNQQSGLSHTSVSPDYFKQDIPIKQTKSDDNNFAILGFVFAFIFPIIGLILSIMGMKKSDNQSLAVAGFVISLIFIIICFILILTVCITAYSVSSYPSYYY